MTVNIRKRKKKNGFSYTVYVDYGIVNRKAKKRFTRNF